MTTLIRINLSGAIILILTSILAIAIGPTAILATIFDGLDATATTILFDIRLPRVLMAACCGALLSLAGFLLQTILRNPLADPYVLGISAGASFGAVSARVLCTFFVLSIGPWVAIGSCTGALLSVAIVIVLATPHPFFSSTTLVLTGFVVGIFFAALTALATTFLNHLDVSQQVYWLMGNIPPASIAIIISCATLAVLAWSGIIFIAPHLNTLLLGDALASSSGLNVRAYKRFIFIFASLLTAIVVAVCGPIGFVGLVIPHACRLLGGGECRRLSCLCVWSGAIFLVLADWSSRTLFAPLEIPVGVVTAIIGAPYFLILLRQRPNYVS